MIETVWQQFLTGMLQTTWYEYIAVASGIISVWYSRKENILVYPTGLASTIIYIYLSYKYHLLGEAAVNIYYSFMSLYGWWLWSLKDKSKHHLVTISFSNRRWWLYQVSFFFRILCYAFCLH
ncbi:MAG: nicotinamide mononucleotide transporter family protein [Lacibacter sp.]